MPDDRPVSLRELATEAMMDALSASEPESARRILEQPSYKALVAALSTPAGHSPEPRDDPSWTLRRGHAVAEGREFTTVISGEDADRPTIEVESIERAAYWHARWYAACQSPAPSSREEAATEDQIEAATDAILALNRTEEDYGDGQRLTHMMARRRAIAALSAARPSSRVG